MTEFDKEFFGIQRPRRTPASIKDVVILDSIDPTDALTNLVVIPFVAYDEYENARAGNICAMLRRYDCHNVPHGDKRAKHFHRVGTEAVRVINGGLIYHVEDVWGNEVKRRVNPGQTIVVSPFLFHEAESTSDGTSFAAYHNTLYDPNNPRTHDTFDRETFDALKRFYTV